MRRLVMSDSGFDIEAFPRARMLLQSDGLRERLARESLSRAVVEGLGLVETPVAHGTLGVDSHTLFESPC